MRADNPDGLVIYLVNDDDRDLGLIDVSAIDETELRPDA